jgi:hypothetical protein
VIQPSQQDSSPVTAFRSGVLVVHQPLVREVLNILKFETGSEHHIMRGVIQYVLLQNSVDEFISDDVDDFFQAFRELTGYTRLLWLKGWDFQDRRADQLLETLSTLQVPNLLLMDCTGLEALARVLQSNNCLPHVQVHQTTRTTLTELSEDKRTISIDWKGLGATLVVAPDLCRLTILWHPRLSEQEAALLVGPSSAGDDAWIIEAMSGEASSKEFVAWLGPLYVDRLARAARRNVIATRLSRKAIGHLALAVSSSSGQPAAESLVESLSWGLDEAIESNKDVIACHGVIEAILRLLHSPGNCWIKVSTCKLMCSLKRKA